MFTILYRIDQAINYFTGGSPYETLSLRFARNSAGGCKVCRVLCFMLDIVDPGHCPNTLSVNQEIEARKKTLDPTG